MDAETWKVIAGILIGMASVILKNEFFKGRKTKQIDQNSEEIKSLKDRFAIVEGRVTLIDKENAVQEQKIFAIQQDHRDMNAFMRELTRNLDENTQAIVSLKATNQGVKELLEALLKGNLILKQ